MKLKFVPLFAVLLLAADGLRAAPILTLTSTPVDLSNLSVGQTITVQVNLDLNGGPSLSLLTSEVDFDPSIFAAPTNITAGSIVPDAADSFLGASFSDSADASFDSTFTVPAGEDIVAGGEFFSFSLMAETPGSGSITFGPASANDTSGGEFDNIGSGSLPYTVVPVPEPAAILGLALACPLITRRQRKLVL